MAATDETVRGGEIFLESLAVGRCVVVSQQEDRWGCIFVEIFPETVFWDGKAGLTKACGSGAKDT